MTETIFLEVQKEHGQIITDDWLCAYVERLEGLPVHYSFGWGWAVLMASRKFAPWICERAKMSHETKPYGCEMCGEKPATMYHIYIGRVCPDCHAICKAQEH